MILTKQEYDQILREKAQAEQETRNTKFEAEKTIKRAQDDALGRVRNAEEEARQSVECIKQELATEQAKSAYQRRLNENLLRISKERANADRNLKPKMSCFKRTKTETGRSKKSGLPARIPTGIPRCSGTRSGERSTPSTM